MTKQPIFGFPDRRLAFSELDKTASNTDAFDVLRNSDNWPTRTLCLTGPPKCGLTRAAQAWALEKDGVYFTPKDIDNISIKRLARLGEGMTTIDDAEQVSRQDTLLAIMEQHVSRGGRLLLTAHTPPPRWVTEIEDLKSRLNALPVVEILSPDEDTLRKRLIATARDYFMILPADVVNFLALRLDLSYEAIDACVAKISELVSDVDRAPSIPIAREVVLSLGLGDEALE